MSFCIPRRSLCHRTAFSSSLCTRSLALRLLAFPLRVFPTPLQRARARSLFFLLFPRSLPPSLLPRSLLCRPFVGLSILLDYVFFSRVSFLFLIPLSFSPVHPLSLLAFRHFSLFLYLFSSDPPPPLLPFPLSHTLPLYFSSRPFPFPSSVSLSQFSSAPLFSHSTRFFRSSCIHSYV